MTGIVINRLENGKVVQAWYNYDLLGLMQQLGVVPAPGQADRIFVAGYIISTWQRIAIAIQTQRTGYEAATGPLSSRNSLLLATLTAVFFGHGLTTSHVHHFFHISYSSLFACWLHDNSNIKHPTDK